VEKLFHSPGKMVPNPRSQLWKSMGNQSVPASACRLLRIDRSEPTMTTSHIRENPARDFEAAITVAPRWPFDDADSTRVFVALAVLVAVVYYHVIAKLVTDWWQIADFSHGFLVVPFAFYLVWVKRDILRATPIAPTWSGVWLVGLGLITLILGEYGAELFLSRISLLILLAGLILSFAGWPVLKELRFALLVLLLAIPIPSILFNQITLPLQVLASKMASALLPLFGVPVLREGNVIELPLMKLEVAEACSGIRSLMSLFTLAVFYGYFLDKSVLRRTILVLASVPIAIAANAIRIVGTGLCVQYWDPDKAVGFFHEFSGWVMFLVSLGCLYLTHRVLVLIGRRRGKA